ncbi:hypothetical protein [Streptomyces chrestomyceticus]|uniref:hypothetical protein n=1 Tax=Streptomyces chrestomyceticus TaxID=68185 RepID=UPI0034043498
MVCDDAATSGAREGPRPRSVCVPAGAMGMLGTCLLIEHPGTVAAAQRTLRRRHRELFVVDRLEADGTRVHGELDGVRSIRTVTVLKPGRHDAEGDGAVRRPRRGRARRRPLGHFLLTATALRITGGAGAPVSPVAIR